MVLERDLADLVEDLAAAAKIPERRLRVLLTHLEREGVATLHDDQVILAAAHHAAPRSLGEIIFRYERRRVRDRRRLEAMMHYARSPDCRTQQILRYFGEQARERCGACDACRERGAS